MMRRLPMRRSSSPLWRPLSIAARRNRRRRQRDPTGSGRRAQLEGCHEGPRTRRNTAARHLGPTDRRRSVRGDRDGNAVLNARRRRAGEWIVGEGASRRVWCTHANQGRVAVACGGRTWSLQASDASRGQQGGQGEASQGHLVTPMPGVVVRVAVTEGESVSSGQVLCVVEAMKMENEYRADVSGTIDKVYIAPGQALDAGAPMITIRPDGE